MNYEHKNQVVITQSKDDNTITFQATGDASFVEHMTDKAMIDYFNIVDSLDSHIKSYDKQEGYVGEEIERPISNQESTEPDFFQTGIKGNRYRCHYICDNCLIKENKYITSGTTYIKCRACGYHLNVSWYDREYGVQTDRFNNFASAGKYVPRDIV